MSRFSRAFPLALVGALLAAVGAGACSSSPSGGASTPPGVYCDATATATHVCYGYSNLTPDQQSAVSQACTQSLSGTIAGSCPSTGQTGCCTTTTAGYSQTECYYTGDAATFKAACDAASGSWSGGGASGDGGSTTGSSSGSGGSSGGRSSSGSSSGGSGGSSGSSSGSTGGCHSGQSICPKGCADLQNDPLNCGSCGYPCPKGPSGTTPTCSAGKCSYDCTGGTKTYCAQHDACIDTQSDVNNCGGCGVMCSAKLPSTVNTNAVKGYSCSQGKCSAQIDGIALQDCNSSSDPRCAQTCEQICEAQNHVACAPTETVQECGVPGACGLYGAGAACSAGYGCSQVMPYSIKCGGVTDNLIELWCQCHGTFTY